MRAMSDEVQYLAARATLLAYSYVLRELIGRGPRLFKISSDDAGPAEQAAWQLAAIRKPARCTATARDGAIDVICTPMHAKEIQDWEQWLSLGEPLQSVVTRDDPSHRPIFLLRGSDETLSLPLSVLEYWTRSYDIGGVSKFINDAPAELRDKGVDAVVDFDGPVNVWSGLLERP